MYKCFSADSGVYPEEFDLGIQGKDAAAAYANIENEWGGGYNALKGK